MQHMFEILIFNRRLINTILCFKSNWFDLKLKILNLNWRQEIKNIVFWKYYFTWHTQNITWEIFKFREYFEKVYPFHEQFLLIQSSWTNFFLFCGWYAYFPFIRICFTFCFLEMFTSFSSSLGRSLWRNKLLEK